MPEVEVYPVDPEGDGFLVDVMLEAVQGLTRVQLEALVMLHFGFTPREVEDALGEGTGTPLTVLADSILSGLKNELDRANLS